jgi:hypothetical protein
VNALAAIIGCEVWSEKFCFSLAYFKLSGGIEEKNRCILKFTIDVDGTVESVRCMISKLEDLKLDQGIVFSSISFYSVAASLVWLLLEKPDEPALGEVDVFAFTWSTANSADGIKENFGIFSFSLSLFDSTLKHLVD